MKWEKCEEQKGGDQHLWSRGCLQKIDHTLHDIGLLLYPLMSQRSPFPENRLEKRKHALMRIQKPTQELSWGQA